MVADGDAEDVGGEVVERGASVARGAGVDDPVALPDGGVGQVEEVFADLLLVS